MPAALCLSPACPQRPSFSLPPLLLLLLLDSAPSAMSPSPPAAAPEVPAADAPAAVAPDAAEDDGATDEVATFLDAAAASPSPAPEPLPPYAQPVDEPDFQLTALTPELDEVRQQVHEAA